MCNILLFLPYGWAETEEKLSPSSAEDMNVDLQNFVWAINYGLSVILIQSNGKFTLAEMELKSFGN